MTNLDNNFFEIIVHPLNETYRDLLASDMKAAGNYRLQLSITLRKAALQKVRFETQEEAAAALDKAELSHRHFCVSQITRVIYERNGFMHRLA